MLGDLLMTFFEVARQGSITMAARQLRISQPTVTGRIRQLEETYGVELFHRRASRVDLSDVGVALMPVVEQLMQQEGNADYLLRNAGNLRFGNLRIGATGPYYILRAVAAFRQRYPAIDVSLDIGNSQQMLEALFEYRIDAAVSSHPVDDDRLACIRLASDAMVLVVRPDHALARLPQVELPQLRGCHLLVREHGSMTRKATETALAACGLELPPHTVIGSREAIYEAIRQGLGAAWCRWARSRATRCCAWCRSHKAHRCCMNTYTACRAGARRGWSVPSWTAWRWTSRPPPPTPPETRMLAAPNKAPMPVSENLGPSSPRGHHAAPSLPASPTELSRMPAAPRLALFDLDHTLLPLDSEYEWARYLVAVGGAEPRDRCAQCALAGRLPGRAAGFSRSCPLCPGPAGTPPAPTPDAMARGLHARGDRARHPAGRAGPAVPPPHRRRPVLHRHRNLPLCHRTDRAPAGRAAPAGGRGRTRRARRIHRGAGRRSGLRPRQGAAGAGVARRAGHCAHGAGAGHLL